MIDTSFAAFLVEDQRNAIIGKVADEIEKGMSGALHAICRDTTIAAATTAVDMAEQYLKHSNNSTGTSDGTPSLPVACQKPRVASDERDGRDNDDE